MNLRLPALLVLSLSFVGVASAQTLDDALRYSETFPLGTARSLGVSNSMSALGADYSAVSSNPAGLAAFRRNDFSITFGSITAGSNGASLDGGPTAGSQSKSQFAVPQVGLVLTHRPIASKWTQLNFGLGVSQSNRFEERLNYSGVSAGSITDVWLDEANLYGLDGADERIVRITSPDAIFQLPETDVLFPFSDINNISSVPRANLDAFSAGLAFNAGILIPGDEFETPIEYLTDYDLARRNAIRGVAGLSREDSVAAFNAAGPLLEKSGNFTRSGRNATFDLSFAGNYDEKLMIGATLGVSRLKYNATTNYRENDAAGEVDNFERLNYNQTSEITGTGIQLRVGAIYRPMQALRVGVSYHSPTRISIEDSYTANLQYIYLNQQGDTENGNAQPDQPSVIDYKFTTPSQYKASAAVLLGQRGFLSTDITYVNFAGGSFDYDFGGGDNSDGVNEDIDLELQGAVQVRVGGEANVKPFQVRAGFQYIGAPIANEKAVLGATAGLGFRKNRLGLDLGYQLLLRPDRTYVPYTLQPLNFPEPNVAYTPTSHTVALTLGWKLVSLE